MTALLDVIDLRKAFGPVRALDGVSFKADRGECIAILGENGAGKSSLAAALTGLYRPDAGEIRVDGEAVTLDGPHAALSLGIGIIHQHFSLVERMTGAENVRLGLPPKARSRASDHMKELARSYGFEVEFDARVETMSPGMKQRVEIVKALCRDVRVLILDEPTSVLAPSEVDGLLDAVAKLRDRGLTVLLITHKLDEIMRLADRVLVMRHGCTVAEIAPSATTPEGMSALMMGRSDDTPPDVPPAPRPNPEAVPDTPVVLDCAAISTRGGAGRRALHHVDLSVREGEVLGLAGIDGNGQAELCDVIGGLLAPVAGRVRLDGAEITDWSVAARIAAGMGFVPEDRHAEGLVLSLSVAENLALRGTNGAGLGIDRAAMRRSACAAISAFDIRPADPDRPVSAFSGGNQQKIVLAREISIGTRTLVLMQPTKGLDVGATAMVQSQVRAAATRGVSVLYVSTELAHVLEVADRVAVMTAGAIVGETTPSELTPERLGLMMTGQVAA